MAMCQQCGKGPRHTIILNGKKIVCGDCVEDGLTDYNTCCRCRAPYKSEGMDIVLCKKCREEVGGMAWKIG